MTTDEITAMVIETDQRSRSNTHRIDSLEGDYKALNKMSESIAIIATEQKNQTSQIGEIKTDVQELKGRPGKQWDKIVTTILTAIATGIVGYILAIIGMKG